MINRQYIPLWKHKIRTIFLCIIGLFFSSMVSSHPHAFIDMHTDFLLENNKLIGFQMKWLLDEPSSAELLYELKISQDKAKKQQELSDEMIKNIVNEHYFSYFYNEKNQPIKYTAKPTDYGLKALQGRVLFHFRFYLSKPLPLEHIKTRLLTYDPTYYVAMGYPHQRNVSIISKNSNAERCELTLNQPKVDENLQNYAQSLDKDQRYEDNSLGVQFAQEVVFVCQ